MSLPAPNIEQAKGAARFLIGHLGTAIAAYAVGKGWVSGDTTAQILSDPLVYTIVVTAIMFVWNLITKTQKNLAVAVTNADPKAIVVASAAVAAATPDSPNIVSGATAKVVSK